jgi:hypothetical protein
VTKTLLNEGDLALAELRGFRSRVGSEYRYTGAPGKNELPFVGVRMPSMRPPNRHP